VRRSSGHAMLAFSILSFAMSYGLSFSFAPWGYWAHTSFVDQFVPMTSVGT
jgi:hypothetical protein